VSEHDSETGVFEGIAGRIFAGAMSLEALVTGVILTAIMKGSDYSLEKAGEGDLSIIVAVLLISVFLCRFALNGLGGEGRGLFLSEAGGTWGTVMAVSLRFLALWAIWTIPLELMDLSKDKVMQTLTMVAMNQGGSGAVSMTVLTLLAMSICPPVFLIVAVGASSFFDIFIPSHWARLFSGRKSQLAFIYAIYLGGLGILLTVGFSLILAVSIQSGLAGDILGWALTALAVGYGVDVLGRLCGAFVLSGPTGEETVVELDGEPDTPEGAEADFAPVVVSSSALAVAEPAKPILEDARDKVVAVLDWNEDSPDRAIVELEGLRTEFAPDPLVLHTLCILYNQAGRKSESVSIAGEALPLFLERGASRLAADVLITHLASVDQFNLEASALAGIADSLIESNEIPHAEAMYRILLEQNSQDRHAVKALLRIAEGLLRRDGDPKKAREIYGFLLEKSAESPLTEFMKKGISEADRRLAA